jgi:hypothetical protein
MISQLRALYTFADRFDLLIGPGGGFVRNPRATDHQSTVHGRLPAGNTSLTSGASDL